MGIEPMPGYVLVEDQEERIAGVVIAEEEQKQSQTGKVLACGKDFDSLPMGSTHIDGFMFIKCPVKKGDVVAYKKYTGNELEHKGKKYKMIGWGDIIGIIE